MLGNRYQILQLLGEGGMGAVYKANDRELDRLVALKIVRPSLALSSEILHRFKQELILARQVTHRNVIRIFDLGEADGIKFITMEFIDGETLTTILRREGKLTPLDASHIIQQVCRGLEAAHAEGVIHRDLKPANIMRDPQQRIVVMDFGVAHVAKTAEVTSPRPPSGDASSLQAQPLYSRTGVLVGTPRYMAPEQALGQEADVRSDIFALGIIFFELLSGKLPFPVDAPDALLIRTREKAKPVHVIDPKIPRSLSKIVERCLEPKLDLRYQTATQVLTHLDAWLAPAWRKAAKWVAAAAAVLLLVATQIVTQRAHKTPIQHPPVSVLVADFKNDTKESVFDGTLEPVFSTALEGASFINTYRRASAHRLAKQIQPAAIGMDESLARLVAVREGVAVVVSGSISRADGGFRLSARAVDSNSGKPIAAREVTVANKDAVLRAIGKLATPIRKQLGDKTPESAQLAAEESFTTSSMEAAHWYSLGRDAVEQGQFNQAIQNYGKAVQLDPNMGRAWAGMAVSSVNLKKTSDAEQYYKKTLNLLDRMSERERYRTLATYYSAFQHNYPQAIETYQKLVFLYPGDTGAYNNMSVAYVFTLNFPKAMEAVRHAISSNPHDLQWRVNYSQYAMYAGDFASAISESQSVIQENPSFQYAYLPLAVSTLAGGDADGARATYAKLEKINPETASVANIGKADLEMYFGHYKKALEILDKGISDDEKEKNTGEMALKYVARSEAQVARGKRQEAAKAAEKAASLSKDETVLYPAARVLVQTGEDAEARKIASGLDNTLQQQNRSYAQLIAGEIALHHKQLPAAVENLRAGQKLHDSWISHFLLGHAYLEAGHFPEAAGEFDTCKKRLGETTDLMFADTATLRYLPPLYYWLARAQEGAGMTSAALENYQQFLKLLGDSDPGDPLVNEARQRAGNAPQ
jgi:tetratricopeptide (TPR) repeat protein/TolB-like protein